MHERVHTNQESRCAMRMAAAAGGPGRDLLAASPAEDLPYHPVDNLSSIVAAGGLLSDAAMIARGSATTAIGMVPTRRTCATFWPKSRVTICRATPMAATRRTRTSSSFPGPSRTRRRCSQTFRRPGPGLTAWRIWSTVSRPPTAWSSCRRCTGWRPEKARVNRKPPSGPSTGGVTGSADSLSHRFKLRSTTSGRRDG